MKFTKPKKLLIISTGILIIVILTLIYHYYSYNPYKNKSYVTSFIVIQNKDITDRTITVYDKNRDIHDMFTLKVKDKTLFNWIQFNREYFAQYTVDNTNKGDLMFIKYPAQLTP